MISNCDEARRNGGPAFPNMESHGITIRDYFASKAMPVIYEQWLNNGWNLFEHPESCEALASEAYLIAYAMMKERSK